jgi:hypothetical protein
MKKKKKTSRERICTKRSSIDLRLIEEDKRKRKEQITYIESFYSIATKRRKNNDGSIA